VAAGLAAGLGVRLPHGVLLALATWREWNQQPPAARSQPSRFPPASAAPTAALAATAMTVLTGSDEQAIEQIRALLPPPAGPRQARPAGLPAQRWRQLSAAARGRFLRALGPDLGPADRIRYRTGTPQAAIPAGSPELLAARAQAMPQLLWPDWAIRLMPAQGFAPGPFRTTIAACLLLPGQPGRATRTAITALHAHRSALATGATLRPLADGGHDTVLTAISCLAGYEADGDIRRAAGDSPAGWQRLRRFQVATASPTIAAAAARLRICPSGLSHQFRRLERDIGGKLYQPATSRRPWRPTRRGAALLTFLARPGIQALAAANAPQISGPAGSRYRDRIPISLGPNASDARQAASLFRVLANPTRLAILLTLQTGEQRIVDLTAQLGGSQANISAHLTRLKQADLITSRTQGRAVYYRLTQPELGGLLQAAGQLLAPTGQQAAEENDKTVRKTQPPNR
jgi:DNA-binding transcriptional ArsR family regulator